MPVRSVKPFFESGGQLSEEERSQIHAEAAGVSEKARWEMEQRRQAQRSQEEEQDEKERRAKEEREERQEKEEREKKRPEEEEEEKNRQQERGRLERQKAEEEDQVREERMKRGQRTQHGEAQPKSVSLDSPMPNNIVSEIKVGLITHHQTYASHCPIDGLVFIP